MISVPSKSIFIPNHPFVNNQEVILKKPTSANAISCGTGTTTAAAASFNLPLSGDSQTVFIKNISKNLIGISTVRGAETIFFKNDGTDSFEYSIESNFTQVLGKAQKITAHVAVSTSHNLTNGSNIDLTLDSNISGGIGISTSVILKYSAAEDKILINTVPLAQTNIGNAKKTQTFQKSRAHFFCVFYNLSVGGFACTVPLFCVFFFGALYAD